MQNFRGCDGGEKEIIFSESIFYRRVGKQTRNETIEEEERKKKQAAVKKKKMGRDGTRDFLG